jgi:uncharacterized protein YoxC
MRQRVDDYKLDERRFWAEEQKRHEEIYGLVIYGFVILSIAMIISIGLLLLSMHQTRQSLDALEESIESLNKSVSEMQAEVESLCDTVDNIQNEITYINTTLDYVDEELNDLISIYYDEHGLVEE